MAKRLFAYSLPYWRSLTATLAMIVFTSLAINFLPEKSVREKCQEKCQRKVSVLLFHHFVS